MTVTLYLGLNRAIDGAPIPRSDVRLWLDQNIPRCTIAWTEGRWDGTREDSAVVTIIQDSISRVTVELLMQSYCVTFGQSAVLVSYVASEDTMFYRRNGVDPRITIEARAASASALASGGSGGSTITPGYDPCFRGDCDVDRNSQWDAQRPAASKSVSTSPRLDSVRTTANKLSDWTVA